MTATEITPATVTARVEAIRAVAGDAEQAHSDEDALHQDVLAAIANRTAVDPVARWCA